MRARLLVLLTVVVTAAAVWAAAPGPKPKRRAGAAPAAPAPKLGLYVEDGKLMHKGRQFRGFGVNFFNGFAGAVNHPERAASHRSQFAVLRRYNIPVARFMMGMFQRRDWKPYHENPKKYFEQMDAFVAEAARHDVGLIGSLFWHRQAYTDMFGENHTALLNPESKACRFMKTYVRQVVSRYADSPAIWGWELGNEYNLQMDLPRFKKGFNSKEVIACFTMLGKEIRKIDPHRIIVSGHSIPRYAAFHNSNERNWKRDTIAQYAQILERDNPDPLNTTSIHAYGVKFGEYFADKKVDYAGLLIETVKISRKIGKPLIIGEFGLASPKDRPPTAAEKAKFGQFVTDIEKAEVPLAMVWAYCSGGAAMSITETNARKYQLEMLSAANKRICPAIINRQDKRAE